MIFALDTTEPLERCGTECLGFAHISLGKMQLCQANHCI